MPQERNSNIELLRIVLILMVLALHFNNASMGNAYGFIPPFPKNWFLLQFIEACSECAVDCFMIISGYFLAYNKNCRLSKIIDLLFIVVFYRVADYMVMVATGETSFTTSSFLVRFMPANYFAIFYIICYMLSPFVTILFDSISKERQKVLLGITLGLFVLYPTIIDACHDVLGLEVSGFSSIALSGNEGGYTIVQFLLCLIVGYYIRRNEVRGKTWQLGALYVLSTMAMILLCERVPSVYNYCSLFSMVNGVCLFLLFNKLHFQSRIVNFVAKSVFAIFCIHSRPFAILMWTRYFITEDHMTQSIWMSVGTFLASIGGMFIVCLIVDIIVRGSVGRVKTGIFRKLFSA